MVNPREGGWFNPGNGELKMGNDFHSKPFDEGTQTKLIIFEEYIKEWLPVFLKKERNCLEKYKYF
jgi:hypothetical protein